jgi:hypothetical protein
MIMAAPTEMYNPLRDAFTVDFMSLISLRRAFLSALLRFDLSMFRISFNRFIRISVLASSVGAFVMTVVVIGAGVPARVGAVMATIIIIMIILSFEVVFILLYLFGFSSAFF